MPRETMKKKKNQDKAEKAENTETPKPDELALANRDVYLFGRLENDIAVPVIRRLLRLAERDNEKDINLYINSAGGNGYNADAIIAIMHSINPSVNTICLGHALSGACEILASGTGTRSAYEFSTLMFHQTIWEAEGDITNLEIQAQQGQRFRQAQIEMMHKATGQEKARLRKDIERDYYLSAQEALEYGIIDELIVHRGRPDETQKKTASASKAKTTRTTKTAPKAASGAKTKTSKTTSTRARAKTSTRKPSATKKKISTR